MHIRTALLVCVLCLQEQVSAFDEREFQCWGTTNTIPSTWVCDGEGDCPLVVDQKASDGFERPDESPKICASATLIAEKVPLEVTTAENSAVRLDWQPPKGDSNVPLTHAGYYLTTRSSAVTFTRTIDAEQRGMVLDTLAPWTSYTLILRPFYSTNGSQKEERKLGRAVNATVVTSAGAVARHTIDAREFQCWGTSTTIPSTRLCDGTDDCPLVVEQYASQGFERPDESQKICAPPTLIADDIQMEATTEGNTKVRLSWQPRQNDPSVSLRLAGYYVTAQSTASTFTRTLGAEDREAVLESLEPWTSYTVILRPFYTQNGSHDEDRKFGRAASVTVVTGATERSSIREGEFKCPGSDKTLPSEKVCDGDMDCPSATAPKATGSSYPADESEGICVSPAQAKQDLAVKVFAAGDTGLVKWTSARVDTNVTLEHAGYVLTLISSSETLTRDIDRHATATKLTALVPGREYRLFLRPFYTAQGKPQHWRRFGRPSTATFKPPLEDSFIDDSSFKCPGTSKVISREDACDTYNECPKPPGHPNSPDESNSLCAPYHIKSRQMNLQYWNLTRRSITLSWPAQQGDSSIPLELAGYVVTYWTDTSETGRHLLPPERTSIKYEKLPLRTTFRFIVRPFYTPDGRSMGERRYQRVSALWHTVVLDDDDYPDDKPFPCTTINKVIASENLCDTYMDCGSNQGSPDEGHAICAPNSLLNQNKNLYMELFSPTADSVSLRWLPAAGDSGYPYLVAGYIITARSGDWTRRLEVGSEETTAVVTGLVPWSQYRLILRPFFTADGDPRSLRKYGSPQHQEFSTKVGVPSVPRDLKVKETKEGVAKLNWEAPKNPAGPISGYTVTWNCNNVNNTQSTENSNILISGLTAELHGCTFKVGAFNKLEDGTTLSGSDIQLSID
ncbi:uncharacterized protein LOC119398546 isoform X5 [Rhipicephalus sanguineus]|uniref:uncharacterized protein LOC119398546 isoform X1 n=1 Tax=Rhipicephalus sanguineus TaxID=34632 RepID=UPI0020C4A670|nr:uncharacterized protein LOC119398546 isoform X1 [Rhipicephalus sanguineus]XP_049273603.1 uncharacterized protein LOC119398546 isoform X2 [Rhipicephalus sanguineus]XP_049273604.1 uncharacterized protein LOC119398546 isoform X3 [Rhipicephalus sanguineus]XP_049273606.1 uncharacterized protein LOC119398546 isoform X5 [Rhipicephalus sanguineus]